MSSVEQVPIVGSICTRYEPKIIGWKDAPNDGFSSHIPAVVGPTFDRSLYVSTVYGPSPHFPSTLVVPPLDPLPQPAPIEGVPWLFLCVVVSLLYIFMRGARRG